MNSKTANQLRNNAIFQALGDGKQIQVSSREGNDWADVTNISLQDLFDYPERFRIKPPASILRPWKPEEVPVGALIKWGGKQRCLILGITEDRLVWITASVTELKDSVQPYPLYVFNDATYSLDHGKTWLPCGVLE